MRFSEFFLSPTKQLFVLLFLKAVLIIGLILYAGIGLGPDEAQYWTWSQALDWGYYSKPPGIAWQIWLGTQLFGSTELGVRFPSVVIAFFQAFVLYFIALKVGLRIQTAFWCGLLMAFCPIGILGSFFAITDGGMLLCWTGACFSMISALKDNKASNPMHIGAWILIGALFKWTIFLFWIFYLICWFFYFPTQRISGVLKGIIFSLIGLLPSLWWNLSHDWATFRHVSATVSGGSVHKSSGNVAEFLGSQTLLLSPILFILLLIGLYKWMCQRHELTPSLFFCGLVTLSLLGGATLLACFQKIQGNWVDFAYPTGLIIIGWYVFEKNLKYLSLIKLGLGTSILMSAIFFLAPSFYTEPHLSSVALNYRLTPLKHNMGWFSLQQVLKVHGYNPDQHFLFSDKYQTTSLLSFYTEGQKRAYFLNLHGTRKNQFSYWPSLNKEQRNNVGFFVWIENIPYLEREWEEKKNFYLNELEHYFERVEFIEMSPLLYQSSKVAKGGFIIRCENCSEAEPIETSYY